MSEFANKSALVTGAASGIGRATALRLAQGGARVMLADMNAEKLASVKKEIEGAGGSAETILCDVTNDSDIEAAVKATVSAFGGLDMAVNNAGITGPIGPLVDYDLAAARQIIAIDLMAVIACMQAEFKVMIPAGSGTIVNTCSIWGLTAGANFVAYSAAKHGVAGATKAAALEVAEQGIRVNAIAPGFTETPMVTDQGLMIKRGTQEYADAAAAHPMNRWGQPEDMAEGIAWLLSGKSAFVTGTILSIDGGFVAR
ncbi:short chain dehydrogenase [Zhengella mangrovi]|uniref:Short chain dehydrogenase n=1 Tax=Zhengella mangrovi TaxID=1982044 RepID=A0A2G1QMW6_9HYPH|nr:SDR family NAD(P)-dependent oxidoreductase [Zhengella mangrovi]PHP66790.1 short chain dehydrogenase [Zhengella mangrovi]